MELFSFKIKEIESILTNKLTIGKIYINYHTSHIIQAIFWNFLFSHCSFCIFWTLHCKDFPYSWILKLNFSVAPWSSFYVFKDILYTKQPFTDIFKIGVLKNLKAFNFTKKRPQHRCFPVNIAKFLRTAFFIENLRWLLLHLI